MIRFGMTLWQILRQGIETVQREVALTANIAGTLVPMQKSYGNDNYSATYFLAATLTRNWQ